MVAKIQQIEAELEKQQSPDEAVGVLVDRLADAMDQSAGDPKKVKELAKELRNRRPSLINGMKKLVAHVYEKWGPRATNPIANTGEPEHPDAPPPETQPKA